MDRVQTQIGKTSASWLRSRTIAAGTVSVGLAAMVAGTTVAPAAAASASTETLPAACESEAKNLVAHSSIQGAVKADRGTFIGFTCVDDLVTVEAKGKAGPAKATVVKKATGKPVDLTTAGVLIWSSRRG